MPKILDACIREVMQKNKGMKKAGAHAICVSRLQKSGDLKPGSVSATKKGIKRGNMTKAKRKATRKH